MSGTPQLLHDASRERDACGIGLVADVRARASRELLDRALAGLAAVAHRGAWAADGVTGDGAGVLLPLSTALTGEPGAGVAMCFLREPWLKNVVEEACRAEGLEPAGWREVPHDVAALGSTATASMPRIAQLLLAPTELADAEARSTRARRRAETIPGIYIASLSFRTVTYKALCAAPQLSMFYPDLRDPAYAVAWAIFHQRFSTNTEPSWERAQPFRFLCHNGEINTIEGNVGWMEARARALGLEDGLAPSLDPNGSDSALLDNALELLVRSGRDVREAVTCSSRPRGRTTPGSSPRYETCTGTERCSWSRGTARPASSSPTGAAAAPLSTGTGSARFAWPSRRRYRRRRHRGRRRSPARRRAGAEGPPRAGTGALRGSGPRAAVRRRAQARPGVAPPVRELGRAEHGPGRGGRPGRRPRGRSGREACPVRLYARGAERDAAPDRPDRARPCLLDG